MAVPDLPPPPPRPPLLPFAQGVALIILGGGQLVQSYGYGWSSETPLYIAITAIGIARLVWAIRAARRAREQTGAAPPPSPHSDAPVGGGTRARLGFVRLLALNFGGLLMLGCAGLVLWAAGTSGGFQEMLSAVMLPFAFGAAFVLGATAPQKRRGRLPGFAVPERTPLGHAIRAIGALFIACGLLILFVGGCGYALTGLFGPRSGLDTLGWQEYALVALPFAIGFFLTWLSGRVGR
ncbi:MAG: hypothetical protein U1E56_01305 [Bauldia sp.]